MKFLEFIKVLWPPFIFFALALFSLIYFKNNTKLVMEVVQLFSFTFAGYSVIFASLNKINDSFFQKKSRAFDMITRWDSDDLLKARSYSRAVKEKKSKITENRLFKNINSNKDLKQSVILLSNFGEQIRIGIENSLIDKSIIVGVLPAIIDILERFRPFFLKYDDNIKFMAEYDDNIEYLKECLKEDKKSHKK